MPELTNEQRDLADRNRGLAIWWSNRNAAWVRRRLSWRDPQDVHDDLVELADAAICEAAGTGTWSAGLALHIANCRLVDYLRRETRREEMLPLECVDHAVVSPGPRPEPEAIGRILTKQACARLPARQAAAFELRLAGSDRNEIAERLGVSTIQAENLVGNARRTLMQWWRAEE